MVNNSTCFVIMPITTPANMVPIYRDGEEHFKHVLECLILPAVKKAGFEGITPKAKGADLIQAGIVNNLDVSSIVLCDISTLNPNVFFEFGIRTALNKPVCVIKDNLTKTIPFDTGIINLHEYDTSIEPWKLEGEIASLSSHITDSYKRSNGSNNLWKYFGIKSEGIPSEGELTPTEQYQYLSNKLENIFSRFDVLYKRVNNKQIEEDGQSRSSIYVTADDMRSINKMLKDIFPTFVETVLPAGDDRVQVVVHGNPSKAVLDNINAVVKTLLPIIKAVTITNISTKEAKKK